MKTIERAAIHITGLDSQVVIILNIALCLNRKNFRERLKLGSLNVEVVLRRGSTVFLNPTRTDVNT